MPDVATFGERVLDEPRRIHLLRTRVNNELREINVLSSERASLKADMSATRTLRVMLVEDHAAFRQALAFLLGREPDIEVVAQAGLGKWIFLERAIR
jgi:hypothetical protein